MTNKNVLQENPGYPVPYMTMRAGEAVFDNSRQLGPGRNTMAPPLTEAPIIAKQQPHTEPANTKTEL